MNQFRKGLWRSAFAAAAVAGNLITGLMSVSFSMLAHCGMAPDQARVAAAALKQHLADLKRVAQQEAGQGGQAPAAPGGPPQIGSDAEYDALPPGAEFIAPDGSHRRKP